MFKFIKRLKEKVKEAIRNLIEALQLLFKDPEVKKAATTFVDVVAINLASTYFPEVKFKGSTA